MKTMNLKGTFMSLRLVGTRSFHIVLFRVDLEGTEKNFSIFLESADTVMSVDFMVSSTVKSLSIKAPSSMAHGQCCNRLHEAQKEAVRKDMLWSYKETQSRRMEKSRRRFYSEYLFSWLKLKI